MRIFSGNAHPKLAQDICRYLGVDIGRAEISHFPDSETKVRILDDVRGAEAFVIQPTCTPVNEHLMELLVIIDALRRASATRITAVIPYYGYARQDRKHEGRVPITAKLVANLLTVAGSHRILCMDLHAQQIQGFFDIPLDHLYAAPVIIDYLRRKGFDRPVVMSPDVGSMKMAHAFAKRLNGDLAVVEKRRLADDAIETGFVIGEVAGRDAIIVDDMIASGGSMAGAVRVTREKGARSVTVVATHGLFVGPAFERLAAASPDAVSYTHLTLPTIYSV